MSRSSERIFGKTRPVNPLRFDRHYSAQATKGSGSHAREEKPTQHRAALLAKVHIARKELNLVEDDYRAILMRVAGQLSAKDCTDAGLVAVLDEFKAKGWKPALANGRKAAPRRADHPGAGKARSMWISLHQLGVIGNPSEAALEAFAKRQIGSERLQWAPQGKINQLVEALKAMAERAGWDQSLKGVRPEHAVTTLKRRLVLRLLAMLVEAGEVPGDWLIERAAFELGGIEIAGLQLATASELDQIAKAFGDMLREARR